MVPVLELDNALEEGRDGPPMTISRRKPLLLIRLSLSLTSQCRVIDGVVQSSDEANGLRLKQNSRCAT